MCQGYPVYKSGKAPSRTHGQMFPSTKPLPRTPTRYMVLAPLRSYAQFHILVPVCAVTLALLAAPLLWLSSVLPIVYFIYCEPVESSPASVDAPPALSHVRSVHVCGRCGTVGSSPAHVRGYSAHVNVRPASSHVRPVHVYGRFGFVRTPPEILYVPPVHVYRRCGAIGSSRGRIRGYSAHVYDYFGSSHTRHVCA